MVVLMALMRDEMMVVLMDVSKDANLDEMKVLKSEIAKVVTVVM
jgi:hypothetical protein